MQPLAAVRVHPSSLFDPETVCLNPRPDAPAYFGTHRGPAAAAKNVFRFVAENLQLELYDPRE